MAAAGGSNAAHQRMRGQEFLVCGICLDHFTLPKILPCAHTFCQACLETYAGRRRFIYCPNCRRVAELDSTSGVRGLPGNFWVTNLRDVIAERDSENPDVKGRLQGNRCKLHPGEQCRHFCQDCHVPVCGECLFSEHNGHALERLERVLSEVRQELRKCLEIAQQIAGELKMVLHEFESRREGKNKIEQPETPDEEAETERQRIDWADAMLNRLLKAFKFSRRAAELYDYGGLQRCKKLLADLINQTNDIMVTERAKVREISAILYGSEQPKTTAPARDETEDRSNGNLARTTHAQLLRGGVGEVKFYHPFSVVVSKNGDTYVLDMYRCGRVHVFGPGRNLLRRFELDLNGHAATRVTGGITLFKSSTLCWVGTAYMPSNVDTLLQRCSSLSQNFFIEFDHQGNIKKNVSITLAGEIADAALLRHGTVAIAISSNVHVLDDQAQEIFHFRASDFSPVEKMCINEQNGDILVSLWPENVIKVFDLRGKLKLQFGCYGNADGQLDQPKGLCVDPEGRILVADSGNKRVALFDGSGVFLKNVATEGDGLKEPHALYASRDGKVVVTDIGTHSVHVMEY
ncbi:tripartite motif-containing protein 3-like [Branchiostoma floridae]|uniref:RING-type E3 ubiquitin transferase n=1 Tax=Branchiostoma floridae TaxID=7739 RepID=A0A9J7KVU8_BRAFL|nr:tripartite motif-containing protein 3-like [Branchiostoma floridae]